MKLIENKLLKHLFLPIFLLPFFAQAQFWQGGAIQRETSTDSLRYLYGSIIRPFLSRAQSDARYSPISGSTNYIRNQNGSNLSAQTAKFWVSDTIKTSKLFIANLTTAGSRSILYSGQNASDNTSTSTEIRLYSGTGTTPTFALNNVKTNDNSTSGSTGNTRTFITTYYDGAQTEVARWDRLGMTLPLGITTGNGPIVWSNDNSYDIGASGMARPRTGYFGTSVVAPLFSGTATNATNVGITDDNSTNATMYPAWVTANTGNLPIKVSSTGMSFNPSTGVLSTKGGFTSTQTSGAALTATSGTTGALYNMISNTGGSFSLGANNSTGTTLATTGNYATVLTTNNTTDLVLGTNQSTRLTINGSTGVTSLNANLAMSSNSITMTGSLAATGERVTKGWFTDVESTNMYTVGGTSLSSTFAPIASPTFTGTVSSPITRLTNVSGVAGGTDSLLSKNATTNVITKIPANYYQVSGAANTGTLTFGTHLTSGGSSYTGASNVTITSDATNANTASTIVARDGSGNFTAGTITADLSGNATTATTATNATNTAITDDNSTNATMYPTWVTANTGNLPQKVSSTGITWNPSSALLSITGGISYGLGSTITGGAASHTFNNSGYHSGEFTNTNSTGLGIVVQGGSTFSTGRDALEIKSYSSSAIANFYSDGVHIRVPSLVQYSPDATTDYYTTAIEGDGGWSLSNNTYGTILFMPDREDVTFNVNPNMIVGGGLTVGGTIGTANIVGGAGNMTIQSGTGASRTMTFQTTTSGSIPTTALTLGADQSATFAGGASGITTLGLSGTITSSVGNSGTPLLANTATTGFQHINLVNTGANASFGIDRSTGGALAAGSSAYAVVVSNSSNAPTEFGTNGNIRLSISGAGGVKFNIYGAGTLTTDASGNITATSDTTLKTQIVKFTKGLSALKGVSPISYHWSSESGMDTKNTYSGFSAQNIKRNIPEAVGKMANGKLTIDERPIIATMVNAINELKAIVDAQAKIISDLKKNNNLK